jgi:hypothetical protein
MVSHSEPALELPAGDGQLVPIIGAEDVLGSQLCYFLSPVFLERGHEGEPGTVYLAATEVVFIGISEVSFPWTAVGSVAHDTCTVSIQRRDRTTSYHFVFEDTAPAQRAACLAQQMMNRGHPRYAPTQS